MVVDDINIIQNADKAIFVLHEVGIWMRDSGKNPSKWWQSRNMNHNFLSQHIEADEFYVAMVDGEPAAAIILQENERNQSWKSIDMDKKRSALYLHWLCVRRIFAGMGLPKILIDFAKDEARKRNLPLLRLDTSANEIKLCEMYERLGFQLMGVEGKTAFYQKEV